MLTLAQPLSRKRLGNEGVSQILDSERICWMELGSQHAGESLVESRGFDEKIYSIDSAPAMNWICYNGLGEKLFISDYFGGKKIR